MLREVQEEPETVLNAWDGVSESESVQIRVYHAAIAHRAFLAQTGGADLGANERVSAVKARF